MEDYMGDRIVIGNYVVDDIEMLDDDTCVLYLEDFNEDDMVVSLIIEKWIDEDKFVFMDKYFDNEGMFIDEEETTHLTDEEKEECKAFINSWLEDLDK
jgi:hypothetical protein